MKISLAWLKEFVEVAAEPRQLKTDLTMVGLNTESAVQVGDDWVLDVEVTTNRPDCLSHYGVARELATLYRKPLKRLEVFVHEATAPAGEAASIEIADPDLCARYCGRVVQNVQVAASPEWLVKRLEAVGQRAINNVADITNLVLLELGHPLHAFDLARIQERKIIVRRAKPGEHLQTLDGVDRTLTAENLVIADARRPVALAGVMGGEDSEISLSTGTVLLESAWFDPLSIRRTSKSHGMHTEASHRFERGADIEMAPVALDRCAELILEIAGGEILQGILDVYPRRERRDDIILRRSEIARILGSEVSWEEVERILRSLGFTSERRGTDGWRVAPPTFRLDVSREVDLIEEVARHFGYDRLPARLRPAPPSAVRDTARERELAVYERLTSLGYREIITSSMVDPEENARFSSEPSVVLANPLSQDASALRSSPVPAMLRALRWNLDRDRTDLRLFESGKTYSRQPGGSPTERRVLTLGLSGNRHPSSAHESRKALDFFDLKGDLESLLELFAFESLRFEATAVGHYENGLRGRLCNGSAAIARFGQIGADVGRDFKMRQPVWIAEVDYELLLSAPLQVRRFQAFSKFPAVERDFSLVVPDAITFDRIEEAVRGLACEEIRKFGPADLFRGGSIPAGHYSVLLRVEFQSANRTLTSDDIADLSRRVLGALERQGIRVRSQG